MPSKIYQKYKSDLTKIPKEELEAEELEMLSAHPERQHLYQALRSIVELAQQNPSERAIGWYKMAAEVEYATLEGNKDELEKVLRNLEIMADIDEQSTAVTTDPFSRATKKLREIEKAEAVAEAEATAEAPAPVPAEASVAVEAKKQKVVTRELHLGKMPDVASLEEGLKGEKEERLGARAAEGFKILIDQAINEELPVHQDDFSVVYTVDRFKPKPIKGFKEEAEGKLNDITVRVEKTKSGEYLARVGPCDLAGVGGHDVRNEIIKRAVNQALIANGVVGKSFDDVHVSACVGVRGRAQMFLSGLRFAASKVASLIGKDIESNNRRAVGQHMNAYVKVAEERKLTHWEPREGPQSFFNDTVCAVSSCAATSIFEKRVRDGDAESSEEETNYILKSKELKSCVSSFLSNSSKRISTFIDNLRDKFSEYSSIGARNATINQERGLTNARDKIRMEEDKSDDCLVFDNEEDMEVGNSVEPAPDDEEVRPAVGGMGCSGG